MSDNKRKKNNSLITVGAEGSGIETVLFWVIDLTTVLLSAFLAFFIRFEHLSLPANYQILIAVGFFVAVFVFSSANFQQRPSSRATSFVLILEIMRGSGALALVLILFLFVTKTSAHYSRVWLVLWFCLIPFMMIGTRVFGTFFADHFFSRSQTRKGVTLIGHRDSCRRVLQNMEEVETGLRIDKVWLINSESSESEEQLHTNIEYFDAVSQDSFAPSTTEVWICMPLSDGAMLESIFASLAGCVANIRLIPDMSDFLLVNYSVGELLGMPAFSLTNSPMHGVAALVKGLEDKVLSILFITLSLPLMLFVAIGVKLASPGPILYRQSRVGWNGKNFDILKFRSMPTDLESSGIEWGKSDSKVRGRFSRFIRATSMDELPQLFNVLRGDMSLVGPRPERPEFVEQFKREIPGYMQKHLVKAGITGWAQVHGWRGDTDLKKRIEYDLYYIENWSLWLDIRILVMTILGILARKL